MKRFTPSVVDKYLKFLKGYDGLMHRLYSPYSIENSYDFETEHRLVERCEAGEMLTVTDISSRENE